MGVIILVFLIVTLVFVKKNHCEKAQQDQAIEMNSSDYTQLSQSQSFAESFNESDV
jgi:hypothetical protein